MLTSRCNTLQVAVESELRGLDLQANSLRKQHDKLVQDRLSSAHKLAQLRDSLKVTSTIMLQGQIKQNPAVDLLNCVTVSTSVDYI